MSQPFQDPNSRFGSQPPGHPNADPYQQQGYQNGGVYPPAPNLYGQPQYGYALPSANGALILVLGIVSLLFLGIILGPVVWVMGNNAISAIDSGRANPAERGSALAGKICGIVGLCLSVICIGVWIFMMVAFSMYGSTHHP